MDCYVLGLFFNLCGVSCFVLLSCMFYEVINLYLQFVRKHISAYKCIYMTEKNETSVGCSSYSAPFTNFKVLYWALNFKSLFFSFSPSELTSFG